MNSFRGPALLLAFASFPIGFSVAAQSGGPARFRVEVRENGGTARHPEKFSNTGTAEGKQTLRKHLESCTSLPTMLAGIQGATRDSVLATKAAELETLLNSADAREAGCLGDFGGRESAAPLQDPIRVQYRVVYNTMNKASDQLLYPRLAVEYSRRDQDSVIRAWEAGVRTSFDSKEDLEHVRQNRMSALGEITRSEPRLDRIWYGISFLHLSDSDCRNTRQVEPAQFDAYQQSFLKQAEASLQSCKEQIGWLENHRQRRKLIDQTLDGTSRVLPAPNAPAAAAGQAVAI